MTTIKTIALAAVLATGAGGLLVACAALPPGPTYTDAELQAECERQGGRWRAPLIAGYCETQSTSKD